VTAAAARLCAQQGQVRLPQQRLGIRAIGGVHGDPQAGRDVQILAGDAMRLGDCGEKLVRAERCIFRTGNFRQQYDEFVAALTAHGVRIAHARHQPLGDGLQHRIAGCVTQRVVDALEAVEVHEQDCKRPPVAARRCDCAGQPVVQKQPVWQTREDVVLCQL